MVVRFVSNFQHLQISGAVSISIDVAVITKIVSFLYAVDLFWAVAVWAGKSSGHPTVFFFKLGSQQIYFFFITPGAEIEFKRC